jgi:uncharacterized cupin superfamily protein
MSLKRVNLREIAFEHDDDDPPGFQAGYRRIGPDLGAERIGATIYEVSPGQALCPYHYEYGNEEWLIALTPGATVRHPDGEEEVAEGDVLCFGEGPDGAHQVLNRTEQPIRVMMLSTKRAPEITVYPDSDKLGVFPRPGRDHPDRLLVRRESGVDYWDREPRPRT